MRVIYFRIHPEVVITRLQGPRAMPRLEGLLDQCICVAEDDGNGVPIWSAAIPDSLEAKARTYTNKFLGVGMREVWDNHREVAKKILVDGVPPHTFAGYDTETGLEE
jgi:hypothetical protein